MVTTKLNLSMTEPSVRQIYAKQGDTGRVLDISLDQTPEDGTLRILRPDGVEVTSEAVTGGEVESGSSFESLTEADVTELTVGIEPVQDLNGYDKPWVGGAGKNLLRNNASSKTENGITFTVNADGTVSANGTASGAANIVLTSGTGIFDFDNDTILSGSVGGFGNSVKIRFGLANPAVNYDDFGNGVTIPRIADISTRYAYVQITIASGTTVNNVTFRPMIRLATETDSTFAPYSNICPITGHDEVTVTDVGKNLLNKNALTTGGIDANGNEVVNNGARRSGFIPVVGDYVTYTNAYAGDTNRTVFSLYDANKAFIRRELSAYGVVGNPVVFTFPTTGVSYVRLSVAYNNIKESASNLQLELGSTATAYEPYQGSTYTTSLGQTVYGGTLDMVTGVLTVDKAMVDLGTLSWTKDPNLTRFYAYLDGAKAPSTNAEVFVGISSAYTAVSLGDISAYRTRDGIMALSTGANLSVRNLALNNLSATDFATAITGQQLVFELATPVEYQLTPQQIKTLVGTNNVWASSGDIVNIKFAYGGLLSELPSDATSVVGKCYCDVEQNGVSSMPFTLNVKKNERES